ncbi:hypothetical protein B0T16DRAFT_460334 [Cercophora newfieldiana]|uniref:Uncharacterized protein n=1 Tax=Cercophora newfieldiana TaxID=92897 RepID=A0AA40CMB9_9PEZI|nr:hypothetical protein B0T16DRAFT_460334 [Cercophora newfieldiana]
MPTVEAPRQQAPMEATNPARSASVPSVVTQQPKSEPLPRAENDMSLRGGGFTIGCHERCCGMNCSWYKGCC